MKNYIITSLALATLLTSATIYADALKTTSAENMVGNLTETVAALKKQSTLPVFYPTEVPVLEKQDHLYASSASYASNPDYNKYWVINIDSTPDCQGKRVCNVGSVTAEKQGKLEKTYTTLPDQKKHAKQRIKLAKKYVGYYTPFHTEAGGVGPTLQWQADDVLYTLEWRDIDAKASKKALTAMANSAINSN